MLRVALYLPMWIVKMAVYSDHTPLAALVSLFTAMPLSTNPKDLQRGCIVTTAVFSITLFAVFFYGNSNPNNPDAFSSSGSGGGSYLSVIFDERQSVSGDGDNATLILSSGSGNSDGSAFQALDSLTFAGLAIALVAIKLVAYLVGLWKLQPAVGALPVETTGFELFALNTAEDKQASALTASNLHSLFLEHFRAALFNGNPPEYSIDSFHHKETITTLPSDIDNLIEAASCLLSINFKGCKELKMLPEWIGQLTNLESLHLKGCAELTMLPESKGQLTSLPVLDLSYCGKLMTLPESIGQLTNLQSLNLNLCKNLTMLPESIGQLTNLPSLKLAGCVSLKKPLPDLSHLLPTYLLREADDVA